MPRPDEIGPTLGALLLLLLLAPGAGLPGQESRPGGPVVVTRAGPVEGRPLPDALYTFKGIPYAAPPVGPLRWKPPVPHPPWEAPRACHAFGPGCPQPAGRARGVRAEDEACLTLNIWTPRLGPEARLPVLFWIHGGGMVVGSGSLPLYDGAALAGQGAVVVTINYRLGPLGFLAHPLLSGESAEQVSGNYGLWDQIAALRWVRENIAGFGGDPGCVTLFGESAGAVSIACLLAAPPAAGLFHRAILQSGTAVAVRARLAEAQAAGAALAARLGANDLAALRALPPQALLAAAPPKVGLFGPGAAYGPVIDGRLLPGPPHALVAEGRWNRVPVLLGTNADEAAPFLDGLAVRRPMGYRLLVRGLFGADAEAVLALFPAESEAEVKPALNRLVTAGAFIGPARTLARSITGTEGTVWLYHFTRVPPLAAFLAKGAAHGLELPYLFGTGGAALGAPIDRALSRTMQGLWLAFARSGAPAGAGLPAWPAYSLEKDEHLEFGSEVRTGAGLRAADCDLLERIHGRLLDRLGGR